MSAQPDLVPVVNGVADFVINTAAHPTTLPAVAALIPVIGAELQQAVLVAERRIPELRALLRDMIAHPDAVKGDPHDSD